MQASLSALCLLVPFLWNPWSFSTGSYPMFYAVKEHVSWVLIALMTAGWLNRWCEGARMVVDRSLLLRVFLPVGMLVLWAAAGHLVSVNREAGWGSLVNLVLYLLLFMALATSVRREEFPRWIALALAAAALTGLLCVLQFFNLDPIFSSIPLEETQLERTRLRVIGIVGQVGLAGAYLALALPVAVAFTLAAPKPYRWWGLAATILIGAGTVATLTRAAIVGALMGVLVTGLLLALRKDWPVKQWVRRFGLGLGVIVLGVVLAVGLVPSLQKRFTKPVVQAIEGDWDAALNRRYFPWRVTGLMIQDRPFLGSGIGTFASQYGGYHIRAIEEKGYAHPGTRLQWAHAHNEYLQLWAEMGLVGLSLVLWAFGGLMLGGVRFVRAGNSSCAEPWDDATLTAGLLGGLATGLVIAAVNFVAHQPMTAFLLVLFSSLVAATMRRTGQRVKAGKPLLRGWKLRAAKIAVVVLAGAVSWEAARPLLAQHHEDRAMTMLARVHKEGETQGAGNARFLLEEAVRDLHRSRQLDPSRWSVHNNLGLAHLYRREVRVAVEQFEASLRYAATPAAYTNLGFSYEQLGDRDKAAYYYRRALLLNPRFQKAREGLAEVEGQRS